MRTQKNLIILIGLMIISATLVGAYTTVSGIKLPDQSVTMNVKDGTKSYWDVHLYNVPAGYDVTNGLYLGWCASFGIIMPRNTNLTVTLYDSYGALPALVQDNDWDKVNWILNHKDSYSMLDIQYAIWYLINEIPYSYLTPGAQILVANAVDGYTPQAGDIIAIVAVPERSDVQVAFIELTLPCGNEGLTPGFWKNHLSAWHSYTSSQTVGSVFTTPSYLSTLSDDTLLEALQYKGGNTDIAAARILLRSAVAALLNAAHPDIDYPLSASSIINSVNNVLDSQDRDTMLDLKDVFDGYNNLGADL